MRRRLVILFVTLLGIGIGSDSVSAQDVTPVPGPEAAKHLPDAKNFGTGWALAQTVSPDVLDLYAFKMSPDTFREGAAGVYLGPKGAQIIFVSLLTTNSRVAVRKSWEDASKLLDGIGNLASLNYEKTRDLTTAEPPTNCVEAKRAEAAEYFTGSIVGATMCAIDPDGILIAITIGDIGGSTGVTASDAVIEVALTSKSTPATATTGG